MTVILPFPCNKSDELFSFCLEYNHGFKIKITTKFTPHLVSIQKMGLKVFFNLWTWVETVELWSLSSTEFKKKLFQDYRGFCALPSESSKSSSASFSRISSGSLEISTLKSAIVCTLHKKGKKEKEKKINYTRIWTNSHHISYWTEVLFR